MKNPKPSQTMLDYCKRHNIRCADDDPGRLASGFCFVDANNKTLSFIQVRELAEDDDKQARDKALSVILNQFGAVREADGSYSIPKANNASVKDS